VIEVRTAEELQLVVLSIINVWYGETVREVELDITAIQRSPMQMLIINSPPNIGPASLLITKLRAKIGFCKFSYSV